MEMTRGQLPSLRVPKCVSGVVKRAGELRRHDASAVGRLAQLVRAAEEPIPRHRRVRRRAADVFEDRKQRRSTHQSALWNWTRRRRQPSASMHRRKGTFTSHELSWTELVQNCDL